MFNRSPLLISTCVMTHKDLDVAMQRIELGSKENAKRHDGGLRAHYVGVIEYLLMEMELLISVDWFHYPVKLVAYRIDRQGWCKNHGNE